MLANSSCGSATRIPLTQRLPAGEHKLGGELKFQLRNPANDPADQGIAQTQREQFSAGPGAPDSCQNASFSGGEQRILKTEDSLAERRI